MVVFKPEGNIAVGDLVTVTLEKSGRQHVPGSCGEVGGACVRGAQEFDPSHQDTRSYSPVRVSRHSAASAIFAAQADSILRPTTGGRSRICSRSTCSGTIPRCSTRWARDFVYNLDDYRPSVVHTVLATMEKRNLIHAVYTQNIDMLHQKAGSEKVRRFMGSPAGPPVSLMRFERIVMMRSHRRYVPAQIPRCRQCDGVMKPDIVFYGEQLDNRLLDQAYRDMAASDLVLVLGSSLTVQPAASLPMATYYHGGKMVIVNAQ